MKKTLLFLIFFLQTFAFFAQNTTNITQTFGSYPGFNNVVTVVKQQPDGKLIVGGHFTCYQGIIQNRLIRLNPDGSKDTTFNIESGFNYDVEALLLQPDGKIVVAGTFYKYQGMDQKGIIRLNSDGTKDESFKIGYGAIHIYSLALQSDGKIYVGGGFTSFDGASQQNVARLNSNGSRDESFKPNGFSVSYVKSLIIQPDGKILAEGNFSSPQNQLVRLNKDGSTDTTFNIQDDGFKGDNIKSVALQSDGKIIVAGTFSKYKGISENGLIRFNTDGSKDTSFNVGTGFNKLNDNTVESYYYGFGTITIQPDGKILVMGDFTSYQGTSANGLIRLNTDGSRDSSFDIGTQFNNDPTKFKTLSLQSDGKLLVGWEIKTNLGTSQMHLVRLNADGTKDSSLSMGTGLNLSVNSMVKQNDGKILVGGDFNTYKEIFQNNLMRLNSDKTKDNSFSIGSGFNGSVTSITLQNDGKIIVGGKFTKYQGTTQNYLIRLNTDGTKDSSFNIGTGFDNIVNFVAIQPDGKILVGGNYRKYQGISQNYMIRLNTDGTKDTTFNLGAGFYNIMGDAVNVVKTIVLQPDGKILVGGNFEKFKSSDQENLIRLNADGTKDTSFDIGYGFSSVVFSITLQPDGKILVGGAFKSYKGINQQKLIRLNTDGSKDNSFDVGLTFQECMVYSTVVKNDGKIIVGSYASSSQAVTQNNLIRLNTDGSRDNSFGTGITFFNNNKTSATIYSILLEPNDELLIGGDFTAYRGNNLSANLIAITENYITPALVVTPSQTNAECSGLITGSASFSVSGGTAPYTYLWSNGSTASKITGLRAGDYSCKVMDADLTTVTQNFSITTIADTENPTITAPVNISVNSNANCVATGVKLGTPVTTDNCSVASVTNNAPSVFPLGKTTVTWTVKDASNNIATATQIVTVNDVTLPTIKAPTAVTVNTNINCTATNVLLGIPVTTDNCTAASVTNNAPSAFPIGETTVIWTVTDASNNIATATQIVTVKGINTTITNNSGILTAIETGATYKWLECNNGTFTVITNETKASFTPKKNGNYAVEITKNGCSATSSCYEVKTLGTADFELENSLKLYPNPTKDFVTIEINARDNTKLKIFGSNGQSVLSKELKNGSNTVSISHLSSNVYLFEISNESGKTVKKVIKK